MIHRRVLEQVAPFLTVGGAHFSPQLTMTLIRTRMRCVEIPIHYRSRRGRSKITGNPWRAFILGIRMIVLVVLHRLKRYPRLNSTVSRQTLEEIGEH